MLSSITDCSYHVSQGRLGTSQRSKILEDRLRRAHAYIRELQQQLPSSAHIDPDALFGFPPDVKGGDHDQDGAHAEEGHDSGEDLESMLDASGRITGQGEFPNSAYYGTGSGFAFLAQTKAILDEDHQTATPNANQSADPERARMAHSAITRLFDAPLPDYKSSDIDVPLSHLLPSHSSATDLLRTVFDEASTLR